MPRTKLGIGTVSTAYRPAITGMPQSSPVKNSSAVDYVDTWAKFYKGGWTGIRASISAHLRRTLGGAPCGSWALRVVKRDRGSY